MMHGQKNIKLAKTCWWEHCEWTTS